MYNMRNATWTDCHTGFPDEVVDCSLCYNNLYGQHTSLFTADMPNAPVYLNEFLMEAKNMDGWLSMET